MLCPNQKVDKHHGENVASACSTCNVKKGGKLPSQCGMYPKIKPYKPTEEQLHKKWKELSTKLFTQKLVRLFILGCKIRKLS